MRLAEVKYNGKLAGLLQETDDLSYEFRYEASYVADAAMPAISLRMPKTLEPYQAKRLFPFFHNLLAEGSNLRLQARTHKIDPADAFALLCATACHDAIGAITVAAATPANND